MGSVVTRICSRCGKEKALQEFTTNRTKKYGTESECKECHKKYVQPKSICSICGKLGKIQKNSNGIKECKRCYKSPTKICYVCKRDRPVCGSKNGNPICATCWEKPQKLCGICGKEGVVSKILSGGIIMCRNCYLKTYEQPKEICSVCNKYKKVNKRTQDNLPLCSSCCPRIKEKCSLCGNINIIVSRNEEKTVCRVCYKPPKKECTFCKKEGTIAKKLRNGDLMCLNCYSKDRRKKDTNFRLRKILRWQLYFGLKEYSLSGKTKLMKEYGIDIEKIIKKLGPCPGNFEDYHIDHILPLKAFDLNNPLHIMAAFSPENLRWLNKNENLSKGCKFNKEDLEKYLKLYTHKE